MIPKKIKVGITTILVWLLLGVVISVVFFRELIYMEYMKANSETIVLKYVYDYNYEADRYEPIPTISSIKDKNSLISLYKGGIRDGDLDWHEPYGWILSQKSKVEVIHFTKDSTLAMIRYNMDRGKGFDPVIVEYVPVSALRNDTLTKEGNYPE